MRPLDRTELWTLPLQIAQNAARVAERYGQRTPSEIVFRKNKMRVLHYTRSGQAARRSPIPFLMTAPLVMPHYIMDLRPGKSLVEYLVARGLDVYMIDWGVPDAGDCFDSLDDYVTRYLRLAVEAICKSSGQSQVALHGYCQGGLLAALFAALYPERVRALVNQTGPIDFHDEGIFSLWARHLNVDLLVDTLGNVPAELLLASFQIVNPIGALEQTLRYYDHIEDEQFVQDFLAMNTWLYHVIAMPGEFFRRFIKDLYQRNLLVKGELDISGRRVILRQITCPVMTITSEKDHVVPWRSAAVLNDLVASSDKRLLVLKGGHLGMTVGRGAWNELWPSLATWAVERCQ